MKIKPVKNSKAPIYPLLEVYINSPELFSKNIPENWSKNKYVALSLASFILCGSFNNFQKIVPRQIVLDVKNNNRQQQPINNFAQDSVKIAPIFAHGEGSGATGCVVVSPPVFISEDEAMEIIFKAFKTAKIDFDTSAGPVLKFKAPAIANECYDFDNKKKLPLADVELKIDEYNPKYNIVFEYVSKDDFLKFRSEDGCSSSVQGFDTKKAAEFIREELKSNGKTNAVVFYDPISQEKFERGGNWEESFTKAKTNAKKMLEAQVFDFIKWFKSSQIMEQ